MKIQALYVANLLEYASYIGVSEAMLRNYLVEKNGDVCNENNSISEAEYLSVFKALFNATSDDNFGIHYGCYLNLKALGFVVQLSLNASSIEQAVFLLQGYLQNTFPLVSIKAEKSKGKYVLSLSCTIVDIKLKKQVLDFVYCFIFRELKLMMSSGSFAEFEVQNSNDIEFSKFLNVEIKNGKEYCFVFEDSVLNTEINKGKVKEIEILLPKYLQMLDKKKSGYKAFSIIVRNMILNMCSPELPTFEQVAIHFPLSFRTIQRKLTEEGLSFRKITDDIKKELASYLSKGNKMKTQDIAYILGYSEASAYLHAFKRWQNVSHS